MSFIARAVRSSTAVHMVPRLFAGSIVCRGATAAVARLLRTVPATASGSSERIDVLSAESRSIRALSGLFAASESSWHGSVPGMVVAEMLALDGVTRVRTIGIIILTAVAAHTLVFAMLLVPVLTLGWI